MRAQHVGPLQHSNNVESSGANLRTWRTPAHPHHIRGPGNRWERPCNGHATECTAGQPVTSPHAPSPPAALASGLSAKGHVKEHGKCLRACVSGAGGIERTHAHLPDEFSSGGTCLARTRQPGIRPHKIPRESPVTMDGSTPPRVGGWVGGWEKTG